MCETSIEEILEAQNGNKKTLNNIIERNTKLIWSIVKRFQNQKYEKDDLYQIGAVGFIKSIKRFDKNFNVKLSTFAVPYIIGEIKRFLRDDGEVRISRSLKELNIKIKKLNQEFEKKGEELSIEKISENLKESKENIILAMESNNCMHSINDETNFESKIKTESHENKCIQKIILENELEKLSKTEKQIINLRYFYGKTQSEVAKMLETSQVQISRIEKRILLKMRENIGERI